ncbi:MAG TPA: glucoamylase family protein [Candidatus Acidoferrum sp.]|nr:glucoamylase family protein [Candidatus Acidoferrum sp.]
MSILPMKRRDWLRWCGQALAVAPFGSLLGCGQKQIATPSPKGPPYQGTDEQLLDEIQRSSFQFFWNETNPQTGQVKDRALLNGNDTRKMASIAATGFGLTALCIGDSRGYGKTADISGRVRSTLQFLYQMPNVHGFFYHFVDMNTGQRWSNCELSSIDTSLLLCGVLTARQYFQDAEIQDLATKVYERVEWPWMLNDGPTFSMGWHPESGFLNARWEHYCELMMIYLLGIGSPTHPVSESTWNAWTRPTITYQGLTYISGHDPIFTHQYSQAWFDFRHKKDAYANYFENSVTATKAHKLFCLSLAGRFSDYAEDLWGISASDYVKGYTAWGGPPPQGPIDGSIVPCATGGSLPFLYPDCIQVLRNIRGTYAAKAWGRYSYVDAFNPLSDWYDTDVLGIDLGITMVMAENYRSGLVWNTFMKNSEAQTAMTKVGFQQA